MYAVIFTAELKLTDDDYEETAAALRQLAFDKYGCRDFNTVTEGNREIAVSLWDSEEQIRQWKADPIHRRAQEKGRQRWYKNYKVQVVEIQREYGHGFS